MVKNRRNNNSANTCTITRLAYKTLQYITTSKLIQKQTGLLKIEIIILIIIIIQIILMTNVVFTLRLIMCSAVIFRDTIKI